MGVVHAPTGQDGTISNGTVVVLHCTQGELAAELGTTRSTLNRALHQFEGIRVLSVEGDRVTLHKPDTLRAYTS
jgi:CRP-like cAMP-binding protein